MYFNEFNIQILYEQRHTKHRDQIEAHLKKKAGL